MIVKRILIAAFGMVLVVSGSAMAQALVFRTDLPGTFTDISATGNDLGLGDEDETAFMSAIGNSVLPAGRVVVGNNGGIAFGTPGSDDLGPVNGTIPNLNAFAGGQCILPFWDDIGNDVGHVYSAETGGVLIIQWENREFADDPGGDTCRFQVKIFDNENGRGPPIYAQLIYTDIEQPRPDGGVSATVGYQDGGAGFNDVQWSFNQSGAVSNGMVLSLVPEPTTVVMLGLGGLLLARRREKRG